MRIYLIRHAEPDYAKDTITPQGHREAEAVARKLSTESITHLYSSPLGRAKDTAEYTSRSTGLPVTILDWTAELPLKNIDPASSVGAQWDINGETVRGQPELPSLSSWRSFPYFDNEPLHTAYDLVVRHSDEFLSGYGYERIDGKYRISSSNRARVAVVAHGGFGLTWLAHLLAIPLPLMWTGFFLATSSVTTVLFDERSSEWAVPRCINVGDTGHLYARGLALSQAGLKANID